MNRIKAVDHILAAPCFDPHRETIARYDDDHGVNAAGLLANLYWSSGERALLEMAAHINDPSRLPGDLTRLPEPDRRRAIQALGMALDTKENA